MRTLPHGHNANPRFGEGVFRRRLRLFAEADQVRAGLEDTNHAMRLVLRHDGERVTEVEPRMTRIPISTCPGAAGPLRAFVGLPLTPYPSRPSGVVGAHANCTHLHHLTLLAIAHAGRIGRRQYDVEVPDEHPAPVWSSVRRDGVEIHRWRTFEGSIVGPEAVAGLPLRGGIARWAVERFEGDALEAAFVLANAYVVSFSRRYEVNAWAGQRAAADGHISGKCYGYQPGIVSQGIYFANTIETTSPDTPLLADFK
ncbi:MAG: DUF2889 domain-containing protein [Steroidobacteraceae bacterium]|nr:DUF2889 domain-containing protein [Steroidobacteraceae bacterium]MBP7012642.1 DUF2889 domain-containing protein [Steroidobacteraceae bacterium]